ncbi:MAG: FimB/Mfa2 family fimbrial subunit [Tannerellaceae bacterium]|jgi:hypothetical protein|nr:FimB/Mfa2 family fimbrial subunit [Tannerellaceae bacterium]
MKQLQKISRFFTVACLLAFVFQSCIKDDLSDCMKEKRVYFSFSYKPAEKASTDVIKEGINLADVKRMDLYVFDENGLFVQKVTDESPAMSLDYYMTIPGLKSGKYKFVAWGSLQNQYAVSPEELIPGKTSMKELQVSLNRVKADKRVNESLAPLFYASHEEETLVVNAMADQNFQLDMIQDTYTINVKVVGLTEEIRNNNTFQLEISDDNDKYTFGNEFVPSGLFTYTSLFAREADTLSARLTVMRLAENREPLLYVTDTNQPEECLIKSNLVELLVALRTVHGLTIDFRYQYEFTIEYVLDSSLTLVAVNINGWGLTSDDIELGS